MSNVNQHLQNELMLLSGEAKKKNPEIASVD
jgi:hypothetical protein